MFWRRLERVLVPYMLWATIYFVLLFSAGEGGSWEKVILVFGIKFLTGTITIHLYFIIVIVQFYLLGQFGFCSAGRCSKTAVGIALLTHLVFSGLNYVILFKDLGYTGYILRAYGQSFVGAWLGYYVLGRWIGANYEWFRRWAIHNRSIIGLSAALSVAVAIGESRALSMASNNDLLIPSHWMLSNNVFAIFVTVWLLSLDPSTIPLSRLIQKLGIASFTIYLLHEPLLWFIQKTISVHEISQLVGFWTNSICLLVIGIGVPLIARAVINMSLQKQKAELVLG